MYVQHRNPSRERNEGKTLSFEDAELIKQLTGIEEVKALEDMPRDWVYGGLVRPPHPIIYTPFSPAETGTDSRDELLRYQSSVTNDPWDGRPSREGQFVNLIKERYPQFEGRAMPVLRESKTKFKRPAHSSVVAVPSVIDEDATNFLTQLESKGRGIIDISVEVRDTQGEVTLLAEFKWFVQRIT